jgi:hypothetical protein
MEMATHAEMSGGVPTAGRLHGGSRLPPMTAPAQVMVKRRERGGPAAALFGPFGDCAVVLLSQRGGYGDAECWIESPSGSVSYAELAEANRAGLIHRAT